ncbi:hypothetical protein AUC70_14880 [Methyloceanibacter stevinii]|uniref:Murein endopeptidase K n=1 Tax=Methyloceanibacter stevinii TaxID=1774970 RepID=A0A1E3VSQ2_9HYPH|nr:DUF882 domain-containing protein [Methyloceanibacter stevinii]ODR96554.1 hypothetical protein AUC70_14880 [Methyloceanibacter stevinii]
MLRAAIATMGAAGLIGHATVASAEDRTLSMYEIHTHETITVTYKRDGVWDEEALKKLNWFMRDWRAKEPTKMDRELIDLIWTLHTRLGSKEPIHLISAYRSSKTNEKLRRAGGGQARRSQHTLGKAPTFISRTFRWRSFGLPPSSKRSVAWAITRSPASPSSMWTSATSACGRACHALSSQLCFRTARPTMCRPTDGGSPSRL